VYKKNNKVFTVLYTYMPVARVIEKRIANSCQKNTSEKFFGTVFDK